MPFLVRNWANLNDHSFGSESETMYFRMTSGSQYKPVQAVLRAVVGMVPRGQLDIDPAVNGVQTLVAAKHGGQWRVAIFQNTPAALHGRSEEREKLTQELRQTLRNHASQSGTL